MKNQNEDNEKYYLTPKGLLGNTIVDKISLYMYKTGFNTIVLHDGELLFTEVGRVPEKQGKKK